MNFEFELTSTPITSTAGLAFIGDQLAEQKLHNHLASVCRQPMRKDRIPDIDIIRSMIGLITVGKPQFDAIGDYRNEPFFSQALRLDRLPSPESLRQRTQTLPEQLGDVLRNFTIRQLRQNQDFLGQRLHGTDYCVVHVDVSPMDNSDTKKEGVSCTYKKFNGYAPIFAYIGPFGFMLNNELRKGSSHCNCEGTRQWLKQTMAMAEKATSHRRLLVTDAGHDSTDNLQMLDQMDDTDFLIKRNLRKEDPHEWLELAKRQSKQRQTETGDQFPYQKIDIGARAWYGERQLGLPGEPEKQLRVTFRVIERFAAPDGQFLFEPEVTVEAYWTSLNWSPKQIQRFYQQRGTSEQYHSEFKTDLDMERLASGKFSVNQHLLNMGMVAYNLLRAIGQQSLKSGLVPGRKSASKRLRLRTVMQNLIYMAGRIIRHARRRFLRIFEGHGWASTAMALARGPDG